MSLPAANLKAAEKAVRDLLIALGEDPDRPGIKDTPLRVAKMYSTILDGQFAELSKMTTFDDEEDKYAGDYVSVHHVPFYAFCEHHLAQFEGHFALAYIPGKHLLGLSKLVRIFRHGCKKISMQERITQEAVKLLVKIAKPKGAICYVTASHSCLCLRGVKSPGSLTTTINHWGEFTKNQFLRQQFVSEAMQVR